MPRQPRPAVPVSVPVSLPVVVRLVGAGLVATALAGCGGSTPPASAPSASTSAQPSTSTAPESPAPAQTPSASATPTTPTDESSPAAPAALTEPPSAEGAEDVARYFMELYPYVLRTGDVEPWTSLSAPDCTTCSAVAGGAEDPDPNSKQAVEILSVTAKEGSPGTYAVSMDMDETPRVSPDIVHFTVSLELVHDDGRWLVNSVTPVRKES